MSDSIHTSKFIVLVVAFTKKEKKRQRPQEKQTHKLLLSVVVFVCESYIFCDFCKRRFIHTYIHNWPFQPITQDY